MTRGKSAADVMSAGPSFLAVSPPSTPPLTPKTPTTKTTKTNNTNHQTTTTHKYTTK